MKIFRLGVVAACSAWLAAGCATAPTEQELADLDYGACPQTHVEQVRKEFEGGLLEAYAGEPLIWPPRRYWMREGPMGGGDVVGGYLVVALADKKRGSPQFLGKHLYGYLFRDDVLVRKVNPDTLQFLRIPEEVGPLLMDDREWQVGYEDGNDRQSLVEFVLPGETVNNWTELYTLQVFHGVGTHLEPGDLVVTAESRDEAGLPKCSVVDSEVLSSTPTEVTYRLTLAQCAPMRD